MELPILITPTSSPTRAPVATSVVVTKPIPMIKLYEEDEKISQSESTLKVQSEHKLGQVAETSSIPEYTSNTTALPMAPPTAKLNGTTDKSHSISKSRSASGYIPMSPTELDYYKNKYNLQRRKKSKKYRSKRFILMFVALTLCIMLSWFVVVIARNRNKDSLLNRAINMLYTPILIDYNAINPFVNVFTWPFTSRPNQNDTYTNQVDVLLYESAQYMSQNLYSRAHSSCQRALEIEKCYPGVLDCLAITSLFHDYDAGINDKTTVNSGDCGRALSYYKTQILECHSNMNANTATHRFDWSIYGRGNSSSSLLGLNVVLKYCQHQQHHREPLHLTVGKEVEAGVGMAIVPTNNAEKRLHESLAYLSNSKTEVVTTSTGVTEISTYIRSLELERGQSKARAEVAKVPRAPSLHTHWSTKRTKTKAKAAYRAYMNKQAIQSK